MDITPILRTRYFHLRIVKITVALAAIGYLGISLLTGWRSILAAVADIDFAGIVICLALSIFSFGLRFLRWNIYLNVLGYTIPKLRSLQIYLAGFAFTITPGSAGESVLRGFALKSFGVPYTKAFAAYVSERISDLISILFLTMIGLFNYGPARPLVAVTALAICLVFVIIWQEIWLQRLSRWLKKIGSKSKISAGLYYGVEIILNTRFYWVKCLLLPR